MRPLHAHELTWNNSRSCSRLQKSACRIMVILGCDMCWQAQINIVRLKSCSVSDIQQITGKPVKTHLCYRAQGNLLHRLLFAWVFAWGSSTWHATFPSMRAWSTVWAREGTSIPRNIGTILWNNCSNGRDNIPADLWWDNHQAKILQWPIQADHQRSEEGCTNPGEIEFWVSAILLIKSHWSYSSGCSRIWA